MTLRIVAMTSVAFRMADGRLAVALVVTVPVWVAAFHTGSFPLRAINGLVLFVVIGRLLAWVWRAATSRVSAEPAPAGG